MGTSIQTHRSYIHKHISQIPTPALVLSLPILRSNVQRLLDDVSEVGISFRPHVKTLKSLDVTRMMLHGGRHRAIVASTVPEIEGALPLVKEGILDECLYGLPISEGVLPRLAAIARDVRILLMVDNEQQIGILEKFVSTSPEIGKWQVFIKIDVGSRRAGVSVDSPILRGLIQRAEKSPATSIYGFYCHAGHSYGCQDRDSVESVLRAEIDGVLSAASIVTSQEHPLVLSIGSTPTAHSIQSIKHSLPPGVALELHAGNFPANDLQQVCTGVVHRDQQAVRILAEVCSVYPERNEALVNAGAIALSRETSAVPGFGQVCDQPEWHVVRLSQEHGLLGLVNPEVPDGPKAEQSFHVGQKILLYCQHACITAAAFPVYFIVDENDIICDTWIPWKGW
ncbi:unnamed protein product [Penicillium salamii]|nr:unnamed protein product [Penicillium salamii]CAG8303958.1 unnamed protein product [Penicillium salamii]